MAGFEISDRLKKFDWIRGIWLMVYRIDIHAISQQVTRLIYVHGYVYVNENVYVNACVYVYKCVWTFFSLGEYCKHLNWVPH